MEELKLHAFGQIDHLEALVMKYNSLRNKLRRNKKLNDSEKKIELDRLNKCKHTVNP
jgi:SMC interacting uncharacterized protein involved in chromosome segregation